MTAHNAERRPRGKEDGASARNKSHVQGSRMDGPFATCPVDGCNSQNIHFTGAELGNDPGQVWVRGWCENGHRFLTALYTYKGDSYSKTVFARFGQTFEEALQAFEEESE